MAMSLRCVMKSDWTAESMLLTGVLRHPRSVKYKRARQKPIPYQYQ
jgi:hypothetical protein